MNTQEIFDRAFKTMPTNFTSHNFIGYLRKYRIAETEIARDHHLSYLFSNCEKTSRARWKKKTDSPAQVNTPAIVQPLFNSRKEAREITLEEAIAKVKSEGYKVLKPTFTEL